MNTNAKSTETSAVVPWATQTSDGVILVVKAAPRANASEIAGVESEWVKVRLKAPPVDGKANEALVKLFAEAFGVPRSAVSLITGGTARLKRVRISGIGLKDAVAVVSSAGK